MGHMDNTAYWQWEHRGQQGTGGMGHMGNGGNGAHGQLGQWGIGVWGTGSMGHMGNGVPPRVNINLLQSSFRVLG